MGSDVVVRAMRYRWLIFWILACGYVLVYFHRLCAAVVAVDMMRDLEAGGALLGFLGSAYFYPYALMQLPAGLLSDSWGPRRTITLFFIIAFLGSVLLGLAPSVFWAVVGRTLVGIGVAMLFVPTMKVLAEWFRREEFATMTGILMAMGGLGSLSAAGPLAELSARIGWRSSFVLVGVVTLGLALLVWLFVRNRPSDMGWPAIREDEETQDASIGLMQGVRRVLTYPFFWPLALWFFFNFAIFFSFGGLWGGPYLMQVYGLTKAQAGRILSMLAVGMVVGSPCMSLLSNRVFRGRKPVLVLSSLVTLGITALLAFRTENLSLPALYAICLGYGVFASGIVVIAFTAAKELFPVEITGRSTGLVNLFPFFGGAVFQFLLGYVLERYGMVDGAFTVAGYRAVFLILLMCAAVAAVSSMFVKETMPGRSPKGAA